MAALPIQPNKSGIKRRGICHPNQVGDEQPRRQRTITLEMKDGDSDEEPKQNDDGQRPFHLVKREKHRSPKKIKSQLHTK